MGRSYLFAPLEVRNVHVHTGRIKLPDERFECMINLVFYVH